MQEEQNTVPANEGIDRVIKIKMFLAFGPFVMIAILLVLCIFILVKTSSVTRLARENEEALSGVILQQGDLSSQVYEIADRVSQIEKSVSQMSEDNDRLSKDIESLRTDYPHRDDDELPKKVYLTFDDGPSPNTDRILDILKEYNVKATFFTVGKEGDKYGDLYRRIISEGHTLGMHSYSHVYNDIYASRSSFEDDFNSIYDKLVNETGIAPKYYRFPGGSNNTVIAGKLPQFKEVLDEKNVRYFDWNVSSGDATNPALSRDEIIHNSLTDIEKFSEVIILMHDLGNKETTVEALPYIIEELQSRGIPICPISDETQLIQY